jgi:peptidoglycan/LPS O-acetylase OafA/YrhL
VAVLVAITLVYRLGLYFILGPARTYPESQVEYTFTLRSFLAARLAEFAFGMAVAWWLANKPISKRAVRLATVAVPLLLGAAHLATPLDTFLPVRDVLYGLAFSSLLLIVVSPFGGRLRGACEHTLLRRTGECSYSLYLLHMPVVTLVTALLRHTSLSGPAAFVVSWASIPVRIGLAYASYWLIEKPFLPAARQTPRRPVSPAASGGTRDGADALNVDRAPLALGGAESGLLAAVPSKVL